MFKHILVPTDGSPASRTALLSAITLAHSCGARITALHVVPEFHVLSHDTEMLEATRATYLEESMENGKKVLDVVLRQAREAGVECATFLTRADSPNEKILEAAQANGCDLIAMATHGKFGLKGVLLGSETHKVLVHSPVPVLVFRAA
ncbi:universal stress protein [Janthinobacterium sp. BJB1]|nr:universal stress protein [Janthinobacterium sp. BJB1]